MNVIMGVVLLFWLEGCAGSGFNIQPVKDDPSVFVGLANSLDGTAEAETRHEHPVQWASGDLQAILKRLAIQQGSGLMDSSIPPKAVFSTEDLTRLVPALQQAFTIARSADWIVFAVWGASEPSQALEVTSGGLYLQGQQLHILLANHRERVSSEEEGIHAIHQNPFRVLREVKKRLLFYPTGYVMDSRNTWLAGGFDAPVSELVLDYQGLLASERPNNPTEPSEATALDRPPTTSAAPPTPEVELGALQEEISTLKEELSRLREQMKQQPAASSQTTAP